MLLCWSSNFQRRRHPAPYTFFYKLRSCGCFEVVVASDRFATTTSKRVTVLK
jgi:hypothetical protein